MKIKYSNGKPIPMETMYLYSMCVQATRTKEWKMMKNIWNFTIQSRFSTGFTYRNNEKSHTYKDTNTYVHKHTNIFIRISLSDKHSIFSLNLYNAITFTHAQNISISRFKWKYLCGVYFFCRKISRRKKTHTRIYCYAKFCQNYLLVWRCSTVRALLLLRRRKNKINGLMNIYIYKAIRNIQAHAQCTHSNVWKTVEMVSHTMLQKKKTKQFVYFFGKG